MNWPEKPELWGEAAGAVGQFQPDRSRVRQPPDDRRRRHDLAAAVAGHRFPHSDSSGGSLPIEVLK